MLKVDNIGGYFYKKLSQASYEVSKQEPWSTYFWTEEYSVHQEIYNSSNEPPMGKRPGHTTCRISGRYRAMIIKRPMVIFRIRYRAE